MTELIAAGIGALLGYVFGWLQTALARRRRRRAVATALLFEVQTCAMTLDWLSHSWTGTLKRVHFHTPMHDRFADDVESFDPGTVAAVLAFASDLKLTAEWMNGGNADRPNKAETWEGGVRNRAGRAAKRAVVAAMLLRKAGAQDTSRASLDSITAEDIQRIARPRPDMAKQLPQKSGPDIDRT